MSGVTQGLREEANRSRPSLIDAIGIPTPEHARQILAAWTSAAAGSGQRADRTRRSEPREAAA